MDNRKNDPLINRASLLISALDQSAAKHEDEGENAKAETDKKLAESAARMANTLRGICQRIERRLLNKICNERKMET